MSHSQQVQWTRVHDILSRRHHASILQDSMANAVVARCLPRIQSYTYPPKL